MQSNKKGMTLVECIIAMAVFAVATTGFTMAATTCMRVQAKQSKRMTKTNVQSTNLEHFSTFTTVLDPEYSDVRRMAGGENKFKMTFKFDDATIVNDNVYGYYAKLDPNDQDGVYELSFFTSTDVAALGEDEYWITLYNFTDDTQTWSLTCPDEFKFFDNEKNKTQQHVLPTRMWAPDGGYLKFGISKEDVDGDLTTCLQITPEGSTTPIIVGIDKEKAKENGNKYSIYYYPDENGTYKFMDGDEFATVHPEA